MTLERSLVEQRLVREWAVGASSPAEVTLQLRNLPADCRKEDLMAWMDSNGFAGAYDYLHVPLCFATHQSLQYAFINLIDPVAAQRLAEVVTAADAGICSGVSVGPSDVHGLEANLLTWVRARRRRIRDPEKFPFVRLLDGTGRIHPIRRLVELRGSPPGAGAPASCEVPASHPHSAAVGRYAWQAEGLCRAASEGGGAAAVAPPQQHAQSGAAEGDWTQMRSDGGGVAAAPPQWRSYEVPAARLHSSSGGAAIGARVGRPLCHAEGLCRAASEGGSVALAPGQWHGAAEEDGTPTHLESQGLRAVSGLHSHQQAAASFRWHRQASDAATPTVAMRGSEPWEALAWRPAAATGPDPALKDWRDFWEAPSWRSEAAAIADLELRSHVPGNLGSSSFPPPATAAPLPCQRTPLPSSWLSERSTSAGSPYVSAAMPIVEGCAASLQPRWRSEAAADTDREHRPSWNSDGFSHAVSARRSLHRWVEETEELTFAQWRSEVGSGATADLTQRGLEGARPDWTAAAGAIFSATAFLAGANRAERFAFRL